MKRNMAFGVLFAIIGLFAIGCEGDTVEPTVNSIQQATTDAPCLTCDSIVGEANTIDYCAYYTQSELFAFCLAAGWNCNAQVCQTQTGCSECMSATTQCIATYRVKCTCYCGVWY